MWKPTTPDVHSHLLVADVFKFITCLGLIACSTTAFVCLLLTFIVSFSFIHSRLCSSLSFLGLFSSFFFLPPPTPFPSISAPLSNVAGRLPACPTSPDRVPHPRVRTWPLPAFRHERRWGEDLDVQGLSRGQGMCLILCIVLYIYFYI